MMIIDENNKIASEKLLNKSTKLTDVEKSEYFKKFYELDPTSKRYPDNPKNLITLIKWFLEDPVERQYELIKLEYETYLEQSRLNQWRGADVVIKDIAKFPNFRAFAEEVHRITAKYRKSNSKSSSSEIKDSGSKIEVVGKTIDKKDITYMTDEVVVARADTMHKSIQYGSGFSSWCTARSSGNYFYEYRFGSYGDVGESTMYYVYFPKRYSENPTRDDTVLHFGVNDEGDISYTDRSNNEQVQTLSWLKSEYPEFKDVTNMQEIFPHKEITSSERKVRDLPNKMSDDDFYALSNEDKLIYLQSGSDRVINLNKFKSMSDDLKSNYLGIIENSESFLDIDILDSIKNTSMGRRYFKNLSNDNLDSTLHHYVYRQKFSNMVEMIRLIIENKKDNLENRNVWTILSYVFDYISEPDVALDIAKRIGQSNINQLKSNQVKQLLSADSRLSFETRVEILNKTVINTLGVNDLSNLLQDYANHDSDKMIRYILQNFNDGLTNDSLVESILKSLDQIKSNNKLDIQSVIFQLIDVRKNLGKPFDGSVITTFIKYATNTSDVIDRMGGSYNANTIDANELLKLMFAMSRKNTIDQFEQHFGSSLPNITNDTIATFLYKLDHDYAWGSITNILLKYTASKWSTDQITRLVKITVNDEESNPQRDLLIENYLKMFGVGRWNEFSSNQLVQILSAFVNVISAIEQVFGKDFILSKLNFRDFTPLYVASARPEAIDRNTKLLEFLVQNYQLTSIDIITHLRYFPVKKFESIVGTDNMNKLTDDDLFVLLNDNYIDTVVFESYIRRYIDKILQLSPYQISALLKVRLYNALILFNVLFENNYDFTNDQIVQFIGKVSSATWNGHFSPNEMPRILEKLGKYRLQRLDNDSLVKLGEANCYDFEKFLNYVSIDSLNVEAIRTFLKVAYGRSDLYKFKTVFERLKTVVNKLTSDDIIYLMTLDSNVADFLLNYITTTNPSLFTSSFINSILKYTRDQKIYKFSSDKLFEKIGKENVNKSLDTLDVDSFNALVFKHAETFNNRPYIYGLIKTISESNLGKVSDWAFKHMLDTLSGTYNSDNMFRKLLTKPNLNVENMYHLLLSAPISFFKYELTSYKPIIDQLSTSQIAELLTEIYYVDRYRALIELLGDKNINRLDGKQIGSIIRTSMYGNGKETNRKLVMYFRKILHKLPPEDMEKMKQSQYFEPNDIESIAFMGNGKFTASFLNTIKNGNYKFLNYFTNLSFNNTDVTQTPIKTPINYYLRFLGEYIRSHNNTLNYTEFEVIMRSIEEFPDVVNAVLHFLSKVLKTKLYTYLNTYNKGRKYNDKVIKEYKRYYSDLLLEDSSFSQENLEKALDIERKAYPPHMQLINSYIEEGGTLDIYDIADYLECGINDIVFYMGSNWFILGCNKGNELEIADWASDGGMSPGAVKKFFSVLSQYKDKTITCSARDTTSYKLIKSAEKLGYVTVLEEEEWSWGGVKMVDLKFRFSDKFMNRIGKQKKTDDVQ